MMEALKEIEKSPRVIAFTEGYLAFLSNRATCANPYHKTHSLQNWSDWLRGWLDAKVKADMGL